MTEKKVKILTGRRKGEDIWVDGTWTDSVYDGCGAYAVVVDDDGDVHLANFRDVKVLPF